jgi:cysteine synthase B
MAYKTIEDTVGNTPLVQLKRIPGDDAARRNNVILGKLEGNNPAGSVKDRPALAMIKGAEQRGTIKPGDTLIEATSGNTGIALAMAASMRGYKMVLIMPENLSLERRHGVRAGSGGQDAARRAGHHPRPVRESGQSALPL